MIAYNLLRNGPHYMPECFTRGLEAAGYRVKKHITKQPQPGDVLLIWNRYSDYDSRAKHFEKVGATVVVAENGYYGTDENGKRLYALSLGQHHSGGNTIMKHGIKFKPYQQADGYILVCGQRGIGSPVMKSPPEWAEKTAAALGKLTKRQIKIRQHPGKNEAAIPLASDLEHAYACVVWSSACGVEALIRGIPVIFDAPHWIAEESAHRLSAVISGKVDINNLPLLSQEPGLNKAFSNQYTLKEIETGVPFIELLGDRL